MVIADNLGFDERLPGKNFIAVDRGRHKGFDINNGDEVFLRYNNEQILVIDVSYVHDGIYSGSIQGFKTNGGVSFEELERGQDISFREEHVFSRIRD